MVLTPPTKPNQVPDLRQRDVRETDTATSAVTGILYCSIPGSSFIATNPDTDQVLITNAVAEAESSIKAEADAIYFQASVNLPHGAVVTSVIVRGAAGATAETWHLYRLAIDSSVDTDMATANIGTADTTIIQATINNKDYMYQLSTTSLDTNDVIIGAFITYKI